MATSVSADQQKLNDLIKEENQLLEKRKSLQKELNALTGEDGEKRKSIVGQIKEINKLISTGKGWIDETTASVIRQDSAFKSIAATVDDLKEGASQNNTTFQDLGKSISSNSNSLIGMVEALKGAPTSFAEMAASGGSSWMTEETKARLEKMLSIQGQMVSLQSEMSKLSAEDSHEFNEKLKTYTSLSAALGDEASQLKGQSKIAFDMVSRIDQQNDSLDSQVKLLKLNQALTEDQKKELEGSLKFFHHLHEAILPIKGVLKTMFGSMTGFIGMTLFGMGKLWDKWFELSEQIGVGVTEMAGFKANLMITGALMGEKGAAGAKELASKLGDVNEASLGASLKVGYLAAHLGISGENAADLVNKFGNLQGKSSQVGANVVYAASHLATANNVMPNQVMADLAKSTEKFATFSKYGGTNMIRAAVQAAKLGVSVDDTAGMARKLLDFEESISNEMEASAMLGKEVNFQRARELAFQGDIEGATKEMLRQVGSISEFNKMNPLQREAIAKAMGIEVDKLQQMLANQQKGQTLAGHLEGAFSAIGGVFQHGILHHLGDALKGMGAWLVMFGQVRSFFPGLIGGVSSVAKGVWRAVAGMFQFLWGSIRSAATWIGGLFPAIMRSIGALGGGLVKLGGWIMAPLKMLGNWLMSTRIMQATGKWFSGLGKAMTDGFKSAAGGVAGKVSQFAGGSFSKGKELIANKRAGSALPDVKGGEKGAGLASKFSKINMNSILKGAAAMVLLGAALWISAKGFQEFGKVEWGGIAKGIVGLAGIAAIAMMLGNASAEMIIGAAAIAILGLALIPAAYAFSLLKGVDAGSILAFAASIAVLALTTTLLGALISGPGAIVFGAGILGLLALGGAMMALGAMMSTIQPGSFQPITEFLIAIAPAALVVAALAAGIFLLGTSIMFLATSLIALGAAGILSAPGLMALMAVSAIASALGIDMGGMISGGGSKEADPVLTEIQGLRADLKAGLISVNMDGKKVSRQTFANAQNKPGQ